MMRYSVIGVNGQGMISTFQFDARNEAEAIDQVTARGCSVVSVRAARRWNFWRDARATRLSLLLFSQELLALLESGIPLMEALETLAEKEDKPDIRQLFQRIMEKLREGRQLSAALEPFPREFPPLYVAMVGASERTGDMPEALKRFVAYQSQVEVLRKKLVAAAIYPVLLIVFGGLVSLFLLGYVVPRFSQVYEDLGSNLPWMSQLLLNWGLLLRDHWLAALGVFVTAVIIGARLSRNPEIAAWVVRQSWRVPAIGRRLHIYQLARFYRMTGMLLRGGMAAVPALKMVEGLLAPAWRDKLQRAITEVTQGRALSQAMEMHGLTTSVSLRMLRVGERSGQMSEMMERIAAFYDEDMARWAEWFTRLIEPLLMAFIGILIGGIVLLMYMPIFDLAGSIQ